MVIYEEMKIIKTSTEERLRIFEEYNFETARNGISFNNIPFFLQKQYIIVIFH